MFMNGAAVTKSANASGAAILLACRSRQLTCRRRQAHKVGGCCKETPHNA